MLHSNTTPVRKQALLTTRSSSLRWVSSAEHHTAEQYPQTGRTKLRKHLPKRSIMEYSKGFPRETKSMQKLLWKPSEDVSQRSSWNQCHSQYIKIIRLLQHSSAVMGNLGKPLYFPLVWTRKGTVEPRSSNWYCAARFTCEKGNFAPLSQSTACRVKR